MASLKDNKILRESIEVFVIYSIVVFSIYVPLHYLDNLKAFGTSPTIIFATQVVKYLMASNSFIVALCLFFYKRDISTLGLLFGVVIFWLIFVVVVPSIFIRIDVTILEYIIVLIALEIRIFIGVYLLKAVSYYLHSRN